MSKKKPGNKIVVSSNIRLSIGDDTSDTAEAQVKFNMLNKDDQYITSSGIRMVFPIEEGIVTKDYDAARTEAIEISKSILRKMANGIK